MLTALLLALETSCDETAVSVLAYEGPQGSMGIRSRESLDFTGAKVTVLAHQVHSQIALHQPFGGVVPEVAARDHLSKLPDLVEQALGVAQVSVSQLTGVVVTLGPGLIGALMVGVLFARGLGLALGIPVWGVNHVDAHLAPALLLSEWKAHDVGTSWRLRSDHVFPALGLTVSGGHCLLTHLHSLNQREVVGTTADDACGEAFDKVGKLMGLAYPAGPKIESLAAKAHAHDISNLKPLPALQDKKNRTGFSFSGLKTAFLLQYKSFEKLQINVHEETKNAMAYAFQEAAFDQLISRIQNAFEDSKMQPWGPYKELFVAGGVAANSVFRKRLEALPLPVSLAPGVLCSDNATMIGLQALLRCCDALQNHPFARYPMAHKGTDAL